MAQNAGKVESAGITETRERVEHWRRTRTKLSPMPEALWREAIALTRRDSVYGVARALGIQYEALKRRVTQAQGIAKGNGRRPEKGFVEVSGAALMGASGPVIEVGDAKGVRMTVRLGAGASVDVAELVKVFRRRRA